MNGRVVPGLRYSRRDNRRESRAGAPGLDPATRARLLSCPALGLVEYAPMARGRWLGIGFLVAGAALLALAALPWVTSGAENPRAHYSSVAFATQSYTLSLIHI